MQIITKYTVSISETHQNSGIAHAAHGIDSPRGRPL